MEKVELFETDKSTIVEYQKSQAVRLYDVFLLAPFLLYVGYKAKGISKFERYGIYFIGISTILYNGRNYLKNKRRDEIKG
tara:strand:+ start:79 stop:318 length:240 start_codon:yes stop_codon:yes gene_type:complete